jgi:5-methylthioadenosine/S-adenosylhomocysteine deaminase
MPAQRFTVIRGGRLLDPAAHRADPADLLIAGDTIRTIGPPGRPAPADALVVDASERLLIPGLINAHTHGHSSLAKGIGDRWTLELLLNAGPWTHGGRSLEDMQTAAALNAAEGVRKGCTAAYDLVLEFPVPSVEGLAAVQAGYAEVGARAVVAPMMADRTFYRAIPGLLDAMPPPLRAEVERLQAAPYEASLAALRRVLPEGRGSRERFDLALAPTIPHHCSDEFLLACRDLAREQDVRLHMHLAESKPQAVSGPKLYGGHSLTAHLDALEFLGPTFTAAHGVWLDDDDLRRLADHGASLSHNPGSNLRLGAGIARARAMLSAGLTLGLGTDGSSCSDNQNLFEVMRLASLLSRVQDPDPETWLTAEEVFHAVTAGGAAALGLQAKLGVLAEGYQADVVFLNLAHVNYTPLNDPLLHVVFSEDGSAVDSVMIGGRLVLEHGRFTALDETALRRRAQAAVERTRPLNAERRALAERLAPVVSQFCVGLSREPYPLRRGEVG